ncbi:shikimate dehydrogenase [Arthrobacter zhangbolii]|uniref:Shikimate dehydrogenase n=1 Tax=Arthrobacter zhangbolii TaxID=2886936 RepID=A0A9X1M6T6_9MICC|nr:shikimate dehydrogenase [Arthrobacter zhangbolii]MCC3271369.1 shikimate dehydrogenase [Arthrobacter zhangbolii]MCC3293279.1 shikimate dehydrogenase [Arthrobacter zhangbolii]UON90850.1 shikimate dehydrogenase [Arthrobacter zhangbolii]
MDRTRLRAAVLGHPISHSKSPLLHQAAYDHLGYPCDYAAIDLTAAEAPAFAASLHDGGGWAGLSVTMPLKAVMVGEMDRLDRRVQALGVLNTVTFSRAGSGTVLTGHNTDVDGIVRALRHAGVRERPRAVVLGAGGTACAAVAALAELGAAGVEVCARRFPDPAPGTAGVHAAGERTGIRVQSRHWEDAAQACSKADVVISTLPPRAADGLAGELARVVPGGVLLDVAYDPWPSRIAAAWSGAGGTVVAGVEMLLYQAVEQVRLFTGDAFHDEAGVTNAMCDAVGIPRR